MERTSDPGAALREIAFLLERSQAPTYRVRAFRTAATVLDGLPDGELDRRLAQGTLRDLKGIGSTTADVVREASEGREPAYLTRLRAEAPSGEPVVSGGEALRAALKGDLHSHSDWSDGGSPVLEMARAARDLGHDYLALTDHSPRLTVANGLSPDRLRQQLELVAQVNEQLAPFRLLTGIEVDILPDGTLDQEPELLDQLDVVVASLHMDLRLPSSAPTPRLVAAVSGPHIDVLGHCTGRLLSGGEVKRPESSFDAAQVFAACAENRVAVEVNSRPERLDPPRRLLRQAVDAGCLFSVDTDAHAPGQLDWQAYGCARAEECEVPPDRVVDTWSLDDLLAWTGRDR